MEKGEEEGIGERGETQGRLYSIWMSCRRYRERMLEPSGGEDGRTKGDLREAQAELRRIRGQTLSNGLSGTQACGAAQKLNQAPRRRRGELDAVICRSTVCPSRTLGRKIEQTRQQRNGAQSQEASCQEESRTRHGQGETVEVRRCESKLYTEVGAKKGGASRTRKVGDLLLVPERNA